jgi:tetratricopeptide (TPR) repeat protein
MRFGEALQRPCVLAVAVTAALAGCAALPEPVVALQQAVAAAAAPQPKGREAAAPAPAPALAETRAQTNAVVPSPEPERPVDPQTQRAYDDALRLLAAGRSKEAERALRALTKSNPELAGPYANLGLILRQADKPTEAAAELERAVLANPKQPVVFNQLGIAYRQAGQFAKAQAAYERALALDANYADAILNLGILHDLYLRDAPRALELFERHQVLTASKDAAVAKWVVELRNRKPEQRLAAKKEQP